MDIQIFTIGLYNSNNWNKCETAFPSRYDMMLSCWNEDPLKRPSFRKLVERTELLLSENTRNVSRANHEWFGLSSNTTCFPPRDALFILFQLIQNAGMCNGSVFLIVGGNPKSNLCRCHFSGLSEAEQRRRSLGPSEGSIAEAELRVQHHGPQPAFTAEYRGRIHGLCLKHASQDENLFQKGYTLHLNRSHLQLHVRSESCKNTFHKHGWHAVLKLLYFATGILHFCHYFKDVWGFYIGFINKIKENLWFILVKLLLYWILLNSHRNGLHTRTYLHDLNPRCQIQGPGIRSRPLCFLNWPARTNSFVYFMFNAKYIFFLLSSVQKFVFLHF